MKKSLDDETVHKICKLMEDGYSNTEILEKYEVNRVIISQIRCGKSYTHISKNYNISRLYNDNLSDEIVHKICKLLEEGYSNKEILEKYEVNKDTISLIRCGKTYTHISKNYNISKRHNDRLSEETVHKICTLMEDGYSNKEISEKCRVNRNNITQIRCGKSHTDISKNYNISKRYNDRLSEETVHKICKSLEEGYSITEISEKYKVERHNISQIRCGNIHTDISKNYNISKLYKDFLSDETVHKICKLLEEGYRNVDISIDLDIDKGIISDIRNGESYSDISKNYNIERRYNRGKIDDDIMHEICKMKQNGMSVKDISKEICIGDTAIYRALKIHKFEHIRSQYNL